MRSRKAGAGVVLLGVVALAAVVHTLLPRQQPELMVQAQMNLLFAERPLDVAFEKYPRLRPPLYPLVLWTAARAGIAPRLVHEGLLLLVLLGAAAVLAPAVRPATLAVSTLLLAVAHFNYVNGAQFTAEMLFAPLAIAFVAAVRAYGRTAGRPALLAMAAAASLLALTRYFGLQFAVPLALAAIAWRARPVRRAAAHASAFLAVVLVPVGVWMWITHQQTGFLTGTDRSRVRSLPASVRHWEAIQGPADHAVVAARTLWTDFFSPSLYGAHAVVTKPYVLSAVEWALFVLVAACAAGVLRSALAPVASPPVPVAERWLAAGRLEGLAFAWYLLATIGLWSVSNNDPIYTRFLFPAYPLLWIAITRAYEDVAARTPPGWGRAWWILAAAFAVLHAARSWRADALPVRYFN